MKEGLLHAAARMRKEGIRFDNMSRDARLSASLNNETDTQSIELERRSEYCFLMAEEFEKKANALPDPAPDRQVAAAPATAPRSTDSFWLTRGSGDRSG